jgi:hypothetical protein
MANRRGIQCRDLGWKEKRNGWRNIRRGVDPWNPFRWRHFSKEYLKFKDTQTVKSECERGPVLKQKEKPKLSIGMQGKTQSLLSQHFRRIARVF